MAIARKVVVRLPAEDLGLERSQEILAIALSRGGCPTCFSGMDVRFTYEVEVVVNGEEE